jgi:hypothetical protein
MKTFRLGLALAFALGAGPASSGESPPVLEITATVNRVTDGSFSASQLRRMDEATKLSAAIRIFHGLYGRWPEDLAELQRRTDGIDYRALGPSLRMEQEGAGPIVVFSDGEHERRIAPEPMKPMGREAREQAEDPGFKIRVNLQVNSSTAAAPGKLDREQAKILAGAAEAEIARALGAFPEVREAHFLMGEDEAGAIQFGVDVVFDGEPNGKALEAASAAFSKLAPPDLELQVVQLPPETLEKVVEGAPPFYRRQSR